MVEFGVVAFGVKCSVQCCLGMDNVVFVVKLIVSIQCENGPLHSLLYNVAVTFFVILFFGSRLPFGCPSLCDPARLPRPRITCLHDGCGD